MRKRLKCKETIDKVAYEQFKKERDYWREVIFRILALVKFLAKNGLAFRGSYEKLYQKSNGNFLGLIEMLEEFDPIIKEHVRRIMNDELNVHYLGHNIQNELIGLLAHRIRSEIIEKIKQAKYYSIILNCTPDISHQEQMSIIVRYVNVNLNSNTVTVEESFLGFLVVDDTIGKGLFDVTLEALNSLGLDVNNMSGQGYDNGSNMKGKHQGVQKRFLDINPRAFYAACGYHILNLYYVTWIILALNLENSFVSYNGFIPSLLILLRASVIWYEILSTVNFVSKRLQSKNMILDVAIKQVKNLIKFFKNYREVESHDQEVLFSPEENFKVNYFLCIVDQAIASLETRFEQYEKYEKLFGFLFPKNLKTLDETKLKSCCYTLQESLKHGDESDVDADELYLELKLFETFLSSDIVTPLDALNNVVQHGFFPNVVNVYRVLLTIPVTVTSAERSFSKLKLLKTYMRYTMSQERLNGLALISIESDVLENINYQDLIESFASKNARRASRSV
ncbi:uncharacterized protein LOC143546541 [Bidens hawaiensis]|uniref:uncharacterized protein LOC143546541 n=1 Tax=Bidens hawaiensis TaxID=980011 RepID=UPI00404A9A5A